MQGKIIRGIGGFYYVDTDLPGVVECKAKGIFRNKKVKPLVGDNVEVKILDREKMLGSIEKILPRKNSIIRPAVANVDQAVVIFSASVPKPNLNLLDRFLLMMQTQGIATVICFNKKDDADEKYLAELAIIIVGAQPVFMTTHLQAKNQEFGECLKNKTSVLAGPSGVGKSSIINRLFPEAGMEIGEISEKIKRGKHTTRHSELFSLGDGIYIMDTPGFTSLGLPNLEKEELRDYYPEFEEYKNSCKFLGCVHIHEPQCSVKIALDEGRIPKGRYDNYRQFFDEISNKRKY